MDLEVVFQVEVIDFEKLAGLHRTIDDDRINEFVGRIVEDPDFDRVDRLLRHDEYDDGYTGLRADALEFDDVRRNGLEKRIIDEVGQLIPRGPGDFRH